MPFPSTFSIRVAEVMAAGRENTTAAVLLHTVIAQRVGLNASDTRALDVLAREGPMTAGDLSSHTGLTGASVTSLVDRLEQRGLVSRTRDPADRRRVVVQATDMAATPVVSHLMPFLQALAVELETYTDDELAAIARYMRFASILAREEAQRISAIPSESR